MKLKPCHYVLIAAGLLLASILIYKYGFKKSTTPKTEEESGMTGRISAKDAKVIAMKVAAKSYPIIHHHGQDYYQLPNGTEISVDKYNKNLAG